MINSPGLIRTASNGSIEKYCSWLANLRFEYLVGMPNTQWQHQQRGSKASRRKQEVIMLKDIPEMGLRKHQVASVSPGAARNHLLPSKSAVYAHFVNRELYKTEIESAAAGDNVEPEGQQEIKAKVQQARLLKRLKTLKVVADIKSDSNVFIETFGVPEIAKHILEMTNIVVPHELFALVKPYDQPGTYSLPLALLDDEGQQVAVTVQLTPKQVSIQELTRLRPGSEGEDASASNEA